MRSTQDDTIEIPEGLFSNDKLLVPYQKYIVKDDEDVMISIDDYITTFPEFVGYDFRMLLYATIRGSKRTFVYEGDIKSIKETFKRDTDLCAEKYGEDEEIRIVDEWGEEIAIPRFVESHILIAPKNPFVGRGQESDLMFVNGNDVRYVQFPHSTYNCVLISAIKYMEPNLRNVSSTEISNHTLINNKKRFSDDLGMIAKHYNKDLLICKTEGDLWELNDQDFQESIVLYRHGYHMGYVLNYIPHYKVSNVQLSKKKRDPSKLRYVVVWDVEFGFDSIKQERVSKDPNLICCCIYAPGFYEELKYSKIHHFINKLVALSAKGTVICYSHNGSKIEHQFLVKTLMLDFKVGSKQRFFECDKVNGTAIKALDYGNIKFLDSYLLITASVENIAKTFNTTAEKGHTEWKYGPYKKEWSDSENDWIDVLDKNTFYREKEWSVNNPDDVEYCMNDCRVVLQALMKMNEILLPLVDCKTYLFEDDSPWILGNDSISSIGKQTIIKSFPDIIDQKETKAILQPSYYGGRCELFQYGFLSSTEDRHLVEIDINSSYPYQATKDLPGRLISVDNKFSEGIWHSWAVVSYKNLYKHPPLAKMSTTSLNFPNLVNPTLISLWSFEYERYKDNMVIHDIKIVHHFETITFSEIILKWYGLKQNAKSTAEKTIYKMLLNGALGGFGLKQIQDGRIITPDPVNIAEKLQLSKYNVSKTFGSMYSLHYNKFIKAKTCFPVVSAITAYGRMQLIEKLDSLKEIGEFTFCYTDTDSLHLYCDTNVRDHLKATANNDLGGWDFVENLVAFFRALKCYATDKKIKFRGLVREILKHFSILHLMDERISQQMEIWSRKDMVITIKDVTKVFTNRYEKGIINKETGEVTPLSV